MTTHHFKLEEAWEKVLQNELKKPYIQELENFVEKERETKVIYPPENLVFNAFYQTPFDKVKVVIMGQDPYHNPAQAEGLSFSVPTGIKLPPSLKNIYKELFNDLGIDNEQNGHLVKWAKQGVLLLNATLTVAENSPLSHHGKGWEKFTDAVIDVLIQRKDPVIFVLWGQHAQKKAVEIMKNPHHFVLKAPHPSPFSARHGFFGCHHFSKINEILRKLKKSEIDWRV